MQGSDRIFLYSFKRLAGPSSLHSIGGWRLECALPGVYCQFKHFDRQPGVHDTGAGPLLPGQRAQVVTVSAVMLFIVLFLL